MFFWVSFGVLNGLICVMAMDMSAPHYQQAESRRLFDQFAYCSLAWPYLYVKAIVFSLIFTAKLPNFVFKKLFSKEEATLPVLLPKQQAGGSSLMEMVTLVGTPVNQASLSK